MSGGPSAAMSSPTGFTSTLFRALDSMLLHGWEEMETLGSVRDSSLGQAFTRPVPRAWD